MQEISIEKLSEKFDSHLTVEGNKRTIFSGKFGTGKTFFLKKFFEDRNEKYNTIIINPVNYVVSSNEDIFELIKADIVNDLFFTGKIDFEKGDKTKLFEKLFLFSGEKPEAVIKFVSSLLSKFNPLFELSDSYLSAVKEVKNSFTEYGKELSKIETTRHEELKEFVESFEEKKGSIYEHNYITKVIVSFLEELKEKNKNSKNVLIIDDLDRIDPDHIFRILNILSVHNNHFDQENKFGFDHIVIVCDLENVEKIFYHKYGDYVDFDGYIDKFFSTEIFSINNDDALLIYIESLNSRLQFSDGEKKLIVLLLSTFVKQNLLTVRKIMKISFPVFLNETIITKLDEIDPNYYYVQNFGFITRGAHLYVNLSDFSILKILVFFGRIFGTLRNFQRHLSKLTDPQNMNLKLSDYTDMVLYLVLQKHIANRSGEDLYFSKETYYNEFREIHEIRKINWPDLQIMGFDFRLKLSWTNANPYNGEESYFSKATAFFKDSNFDFAKTKIPINSIFQVLHSIVSDCSINQYLKFINV